MSGFWSLSFGQVYNTMDNHPDIYLRARFYVPLQLQHPSSIMTSLFESLPTWPVDQAYNYTVPTPGITPNDLFHSPPVYDVDSSTFQLMNRTLDLDPCPFDLACDTGFQTQAPDFPQQSTYPGVPVFDTDFNEAMPTFGLPMSTPEYTLPSQWNLLFNFLLSLPSPPPCLTPTNPIHPLFNSFPSLPSPPPCLTPTNPIHPLNFTPNLSDLDLEAFASSILHSCSHPKPPSQTLSWEQITDLTGPSPIHPHFPNQTAAQTALQDAPRRSIVSKTKKDSRASYSNYKKRKKYLEDDPFVLFIELESNQILCAKCHSYIKLDDRTPNSLHYQNWEKHKERCKGVKRKKNQKKTKRRIEKRI